MFQYCLFGQSTYIYSTLDKLWGELEPKQDIQSLQFTLTIKTNNYWLFYCTVATLVAG